MNYSRPTLRLQAVSVLVALLGLADPAGADEWRREMAEMHQRLGRLEQQCQWLQNENWDLRRQMEEDRRVLAFSVAKAQGPELGVTFSAHRFLAEEEPAPEPEKKEDEVTWY